ncbi:MAG TPA: hypothetical protein VF772_26205 [Terriglobales bacterium]
MWGLKPKRQGNNEQLLELQASLHAVLQRIKALEEDLASLQDQHERLRGKFYASRSERPAASEPESKAAILARMGYLRATPPKEGT